MQHTSFIITVWMVHCSPTLRSPLKFFFSLSSEAAKVVGGGEDNGTSDRHLPLSLCSST